jgi:uncharacterized protein DUF4252
MRLPARVLALTAACLPSLALGGGPQLELSAFDHLKEHASSSVDVSLGSWPLGLAAGVLDKSDPTDAEFEHLLRGLKGVYIRSYEFAAADSYPQADVDALRAQLAGDGWNQLAQIRTRHESGNVDVYVCMSHDKISGLALIASDRRRFTIINVVGSLDPHKLGALGAHFGLAGLTQ